MHPVNPEGIERIELTHIKKGGKEWNYPELSKNFWLPKKRKH
jgi:hypothetical protein